MAAGRYLQHKEGCRVQYICILVDCNHSSIRAYLLLYGLSTTHTGVKTAVGRQGQVDMGERIYARVVWARCTDRTGYTGWINGSTGAPATGLVGL
jgi:hypothetical protein